MPGAQPSDPLPDAPAESVKEVVPSRMLRTLYTLYLLILVWGGILPWLIPLAFSTSPLLTLAISAPVLLGIAFALWWIHAYCRGIRYWFTPSGISWERGVWFHKTGTVPYRRITAVDILQGPVSRALGISTVQVQAEGDPPGEGAPALLKIVGVAEAEGLRDGIIRQVQEASRAPGLIKNSPVDEDAPAKKD